jgi:hypothetical protein
MSMFLPSRVLTKVILVVPLILALGVSAFASRAMPGRIALRLP